MYMCIIYIVLSILTIFFLTCWVKIIEKNKIQLNQKLTYIFNFVKIKVK